MSPAAHMMAYPRFSVKFEQDDVEVFSFTTQTVPDPNWKFVDKKGHGHFWQDDKLPTLKKVKIGTRWVGDEYDGQEYDEFEYRCKNCQEAVKPGTKQEHVKPPPPLVWFTVTVEDREYHLSAEQYAKAIEALGDYLKENHSSGW